MDGRAVTACKLLILFTACIMQSSCQGKRYAAASPEWDLHRKEHIPALGPSVRKTKVPESRGLAGDGAGVLSDREDSWPFPFQSYLMELVSVVEKKVAP